MIFLHTYCCYLYQTFMIKENTLHTVQIAKPKAHTEQLCMHVQFLIPTSGRQHSCLQHFKVKRNKTNPVWIYWYMCEVENFIFPKKAGVMACGVPHLAFPNLSFSLSSRRMSRLVWRKLARLITLLLITFPHWIVCIYTNQPFKDDYYDLLY